MDVVQINNKLMFLILLLLSLLASVHLRHGQVEVVIFPPSDFSLFFFLRHTVIIFLFAGTHCEVI